MKKISLILAGVFAATMLHAANNIYVVNMAEVYSNYYKAKEAAAQIKTSVDATNAELEKMNKQRQDLMKKIQEIQTKAQNPALAEEAQDSRNRGAADNCPNPPDRAEYGKYAPHNRPKASGKRGRHP